MTRERIEVLQEVRDMLAGMQSDWDHIESAEQALREAIAEIDRRIAATDQARRERA